MCMWRAQAILSMVCKFSQGGQSGRLSHACKHHLTKSLRACQEFWQHLHGAGLNWSMYSRATSHTVGGCKHTSAILLQVLYNLQRIALGAACHM